MKPTWVPVRRRRRVRRAGADAPPAAVAVRPQRGGANAGDYRPLLANYAEDAVLHFNDGPHRWAGEHRAGRDRALPAGLRGGGLKGEIRRCGPSGPPWAMTMAVRFDDEASEPAAERLYANRVAMVIRTRWGRIVEQEDFYEDSGRILRLEQALSERGVERVAA